MIPLTSTVRDWLAPYPVIRAAVWVQVGLAAVALLAMPFDHREILGLNPWIKPLKFDISIVAMLVTAAAFLGGLQQHEAARIWAGSGLAIALTIENVLISMQSLRGVRSHMNYATAFDTRVFITMGVLAIVATGAAIGILGLTFVAQPRWPPAVLWGIRLGLLMFLAGSWEGTRMAVQGGHTVGAVDGLQGLPLLNWSRKHGDLRIAHFFALHAIQAFPILGYLCSLTSWSERLQVATVFALVALYTACVWLLFRQAMQGRPLA